jgi:hypothetical protein
MLFFNRCKGHVVCPCGATHMIDPCLASAAAPVACPSCSDSFCSCCNSTPFHHNLPCSAVDQVRAGYLEWQGGRRQQVLRHLHTLDARFKTEEKEREGRVQEEVERLQQLRHVLCCPHCRHPCGEVGDVRCGKFICGRLETDSAASAVAGGCGREFKVGEALPYTAGIPASLMEPLLRTIARWRGVDGQAVKCECCGSEVEGPLLQCVGCNAINVCIRCEAQGFDHVRRSSQRPCHNHSHYFVIRMHPQPEEAAAADARPAPSDIDLHALTAHVFREDGATTPLLACATTSTDDRVMAVPKVMRASQHVGASPHAPHAAGARVQRRPPHAAR